MMLHGAQTLLYNNKLQHDASWSTDSFKPQLVGYSMLLHGAQTLPCTNPLLYHAMPYHAASGAQTLPSAHPPLYHER